MATTIQLLLDASEVNEHTSEVQPAHLITLADETAVATTITGSWVDVGPCRNLALTATVANLAGTSPTFDITMQTSSDKGVLDAPRSLNSIATAGAFPQFTAAGSKVKEFGPTARYVRTVITPGGTTPSGNVKVAGKVY